MVLKYDVEKLQEILGDFYKATGIPLTFYDANCNYVTGTSYNSPFCALIRSKDDGLARCHLSDRELLSKSLESRKLVTYRCHAGITYAAVPIFDNENLFGFVMIRQSNTINNLKPFSEVYESIKDLGLDKEELRKAYGEIFLFDRTKTESSFKIATMLTKYICFENMVKAEYGSDLERIIEYIDSNFDKEITVPQLCRLFNISKTSLYSGFRMHFNMTVKEYINAQRISRAEYLLKHTRYTVYDICGKCGIDNYQYFCRLFKKTKGITPLQYRKTFEKQK